MDNKRSFYAKAPSVESPLLNPQRACEYLGISKKTLYCWERDGKLPRAVRCGRYVRWRKEDLDRWIDAQVGEGPKPKQTSEGQSPPPAATT